ncbi:MAG: serine hydrolase [Erythrobacter sp.]|uniref:serine hydrolase domain-containing protein n=1 Tax=Erythrobacter sp. TaxID=1042 RepID=UPI0032641CFA
MRIAVVLGAVLSLCLASIAHAQPIPDLSLEELETRIEDGDLGKIRALALEVGGKVVYRKRFGKGELGDRVDIKSAGKSITALAVGAAIADGDLAGVDVAVWSYLGSERSAPFNAVTVLDLLNMASVLDCNDWERRSPGQEERMYPKRRWRDFALSLPEREFTRDERGIGPFSYCTAGVFLLGQVVEKAVGERFDLYVQRRLFDPLGIDGADWRTSKSGEIQSGGQLTISDEALFKIGRLVLDGGMWEGTEVLPGAWLRDILRPAHQLDEHVHYGHLWWFSAIRSQRGFEGAAMMKGNGGNIVALVPSMDAVLVVQSESYNRKTAQRNSFIALTTMLRTLPAPPIVQEAANAEE